MLFPKIFYLFSKILQSCRALHRRLSHDKITLRCKTLHFDKEIFDYEGTFHRQKRRRAASGPVSSPNPFRCCRRHCCRNTSASSASRSTANAPSADLPPLPRAIMVQLYINDEFFDTPKRGKRLPHDQRRRSSTSSMRTKTSCCVDKTPGHGRPSPTTTRNTATRSSTTFRPISTSQARVAPARGERRSRPPCATASTATPAASSSRQKPPRRCAS